MSARCPFRYTGPCTCSECTDPEHLARLFTKLERELDDAGTCAGAMGRSLLNVYLSQAQDTLVELKAKVLK